jgi:glyoxylase-like metal-dependent hydrolase (beta-lactamase superfamily II)
MDRRQFISKSTTFAASIPFLPFPSFSEEKILSPPKTNKVEFKVGKIACTIFRDYDFQYQAKDFFANANQGELNDELKKYHISDDNIPSPFIALLLQIDRRKILIDTGVGFADKAVNVRGTSVLFRGQLSNLLEENNIKKDEITDVIITHFHPDHIGGIYTGTTLNFPNARFHMHVDEWQYWHSSLSDAQPAQFKTYIQNNITKLKDGNLNLIKGDFVNISDGITIVKCDGHTPGQISVIIHSKNENLLYISDAFLHPLHVEKIDWQTNYDLDHQLAKASRIKLFDLASKEDMLVNAFHFEFPGIGRIEKSKDKWKWKEVNSL